MNTDDMIRANLERIARERSDGRSLLGFPVIERDGLKVELTRRYHESLARSSEVDDEIRDTIAHVVEVWKPIPSGTITVVGTFAVPRAILEDESVDTREIFLDSLSRCLTQEDLEAIALDWGLIDGDEARRIEAESNQREIDASRAELRELLNGKQ